jgi:regulator of extracellular matrix RemA (YlzA/DUF370 family)
VKSAFINIGFGNVIATSKVVAIINPGSRSIKKLRDEAKQSGKLIDATEGRKTRSIIIADSGHIVLSSLQVETISQRLAEEKTGL